HITTPRLGMVGRQRAHNHVIAKIILVADGIGVFVVLVFQHQGTHNGQPCFMHFPGIAIKIGNELVAQLIVFCKYLLRFLSVVPGLFIARVVHSKHMRNGTEHAKLYPTDKQFRVSIVLKSTHVMRPIADSRHSYIDSSLDYRFKILPLAWPVTGPNKWITLYSCISLPCVVHSPDAIF